MNYEAVDEVITLLVEKIKLLERDLSIAEYRKGECEKEIERLKGEENE